MNAPLILVNGWPGVGKDTVAETLQLMLGDDKASLVDWHGRAAQGSNSEACFEPAVPDDDAAAAQRRDACLAAQVEHPSAWPRTIICTDCLPDTPAGRRRARGFEAAARRCQRLLVPVYLECQVDENMRRIANAERRVSLKDKIRSPNEARTVRSEGGRLFVYKEHPGVTLNITHILPHEAALQILSFTKELVAQRNEAMANDETTPLEARERELLWS